MPLTSSQFCALSLAGRTRSVDGCSAHPGKMSVEKIRSVCTSGYHMDKWMGPVNVQKSRRKGRDPVEGQNLKKNLNLLQEWGMSMQGLDELKEYRKTAQLHSGVVARKLRWLVGWFGFTQQQAVKVVRGYPHVLGLALDDSVRTFMELFVRSGIARKEIGVMALSHPKVLGRAKKFDYLQSLLGEQLGLQEAELAIMVIKFPQILLRDPVQTGIERMVQSFSDAGIDQQQLCLMCKKFPQLLLMSLEEDIQPTVGKFQALGLSKNDLRTVLTGAPSLLCKDFNRMVLGKLRFLEEDMRFERAHALKLLVKDPRKFRDDLRTWKETHAWLSSKGMSIKDAQEFAEKNMCIMSRKCNGLEEKYAFAVGVLGKGSEEILKCPRYFNASFEDVIMFRAALLHSQGVDCTKKALGYIVASNGIFARRCGRDKFEEFQKQWNGLERAQKLSLSWSHNTIN